MFFSVFFACVVALMFIINMRSAYIIFMATDLRFIVAGDSMSQFMLDHFGEYTAYIYLFFAAVDVLAFIALVRHIIYVKSGKQAEDDKPKPDMGNITTEYVGGSAQTVYKLIVGDVLSKNENGESIQDLLRSFHYEHPAIDLRIKYGRIYIYADGKHIGYIQSAYTDIVTRNFSHIDRIEDFTVIRKGDFYHATFTLITK